MHKPVPQTRFLLIFLFAISVCTRNHTHPRRQSEPKIADLPMLVLPIIASLFLLLYQMVWFTHPRHCCGTDNAAGNAQGNEQRFDRGINAASIIAF